MPRSLSAWLSNPDVYDSIQRLAGWRRVGRRLQPHLRQTAGDTLLDAGAGTGALAELLPAATRYIALDVDAEKLARASRRRENVRTIVRSATDTGLGAKEVGYAACVDVTHHLDDDSLRALLAELARVTRLRLFFVDAVADGPLPGRVLWRFDRGAHPRSERSLRAALGEAFELEESETFTILHRYLLCAARPRE